MIKYLATHCINGLTLTEPIYWKKWLPPIDFSCCRSWVFHSTEEELFTGAAVIICQVHCILDGPVLLASTNGISFANTYYYLLAVDATNIF